MYGNVIHYCMNWSLLSRINTAPTFYNFLHLLEPQSVSRGQQCSHGTGQGSYAHHYASNVTQQSSDVLGVLFATKMLFAPRSTRNNRGSAGQQLYALWVEVMTRTRTEYIVVYQQYREDYDCNCEHRLTRTGLYQYQRRCQYSSTQQLQHKRQDFPPSQILVRSSDLDIPLGSSALRNHVQPGHTVLWNTNNLKSF